MPMLKRPYRVAESLLTLMAEIEERFPGTTIWTVGDEAHQARDSDHNSNYDGVICAIDVVGREQAQALWEFNTKAKDKRTKYQIHDSKIMSSTVSPWSIRSYGGSNPHRDHLHISVGRGPDNYSTRADLYDDPSAWGFANVHQEDDIVIDKNTNLPVPSNAVKKHQNALLTWRDPEGDGLKADPNGNTWERALYYGDDGDFGTTTEEMVKDYQRAADLPVTGKIDGVTSSLLMEWIADRRGTGGLTRGQADRRYVRKGVNVKIG